MSTRLTKADFEKLEAEVEAARNAVEAARRERDQAGAETAAILLTVQALQARVFKLEMEVIDRDAKLLSFQAGG